MDRPGPPRPTDPDPLLFASRDDRWHDAALIAALTLILILGAVHMIGMIASFALG